MGRIRSLATVAAATALALSLSGCLFETVTWENDTSTSDEAGFDVTATPQSCGTSVAASTTPSETVSCSYGQVPARVGRVDLRCDENAQTPLECLLLVFIDPVIVQVPAGATDFRGTFDDGQGTHGPLDIRAGFTRLPADKTRDIVAEPGTQLVVIDFAAPTATPLNRPYRFSFRYKSADRRIKAMATGKVRAGGTTFYPPLAPCATDFAQIPAFDRGSGTFPRPLFDAAQLATIAACKGAVYTFPGGGPVIVDAVEFRNPGFDHYFATMLDVEILKLDAGQFNGWERTGQSFRVYQDKPAGSGPVCRFFSTSFGAKSSHFYTAEAAECALVKNNPNWTFEGEVFNVPLAAGDGSCPAGTRPVYRLYNQGQGGAPNHRYTTSATVRSAMLAQNWIPEGRGPLGVGFCTPG